MDSSKEKKRGVGRPKTKDTPSKKPVQVEDLSKGIFSVTSLAKGSEQAASSIANFWTESPYSAVRPKGLYATYGGKEAYVTVRDDETPAIPRVGNDVYIFAGVEEENKENLYAVVKSKCLFHSFEKVFSGKPTHSSVYDGYYTIIPSQEDVDSKRSPIRIISCKNFKNATVREKYIATHAYGNAITAI